MGTTNHLRNGLFFVLIYSLLGRGLPAAVFKRGDSNSDGQVTIADSAHTLCYLFLGGAAPGCLDAADTDANGNLTIADAVATLAFLFVNGPAPPAPGPFNCGVGAPVLGCNTPPPCAPVAPPVLPGLAFQFQPTPPTPAGPNGTWKILQETAQILNNSGVGIQAWSMNIVRQGPARILDVTTDGTAVPTYFDGGFQKSEVTSCGNGATTAVILSLTGGNVLPPSVTPYDVLRLKVLRQVSPALATLSYQPGQRCMGQPVVNVAQGSCGTSSYTPALVSKQILVTAGPGPNTPAGMDVEVALGPNVWVKFGQILSPQNTTATPINPIFANFLVPGMATGWLFGPGGAYPAGVTVNVRYPCNWPLPMAQSAVLLHNGVPIPGQVNNTCTRVITGVVTSFSEFSIQVSPEFVSFRRGDSNEDGVSDLSDATHILGCQFLGTRCPDCPDAGDANDDGSVDIGDAIFLLSFQFLGGTEPPLPGPFTPGLDLTPDGLGGCAYTDALVDPDEIDPCDDPSGDCF